MLRVESERASGTENLAQFMRFRFSERPCLKITREGSQRNTPGLHMNAHTHLRADMHTFKLVSTHSTYAHTQKHTHVRIHTHHTRHVTHSTQNNTHKNVDMNE